MSLLRCSRLFGDQMIPKLSPLAKAQDPCQAYAWLGKHPPEMASCLHAIMLFRALLRHMHVLAAPPDQPDCHSTQPLQPELVVCQHTH